MKLFVRGAGLVLLCASLSHAQVPLMLNYQGRLLDETGQPVDGPEPMAVALFDAATGGSMIYTQDLGNVSVQNGLFTFLWGGDGLPDALAYTSCWLQVHAGGTVLTPRQRLASVPFALRAAHAVSVADGAIGAGQLADGAVTAAKLAPLPMAAGHASADQWITNGDVNVRTIFYDTEDLDTADAFDTATHTFTAPTGGVYTVYAHIAFSTGFATGDRVQLAVHKNGDLAHRSELMCGGDYPRHQLSAMLALDEGDTVDFRVGQWTAAARMLDGGAAETWFYIVRTP